MKKVAISLFIPLGLKVFAIVLLIIATVTLSVNFVASYLFANELRLRLQEENLNQANSLAEDFEKMAMGNIFIAKAYSERREPLNRRNMQDFFDDNPDIIHFSQKNGVDIFNPNERDVSHAQSRLIAADLLNKPLQSLDVVAIHNFSYELNSLVIGLTYQKNSQEQPVFLLVKPSSILAKLERFEQEENQAASFIIDLNGDVIIHPDLEISQSKANYATLPAVKRILENNMINNLQSSYIEDGKEYWASVAKGQKSHLLSVVVVPSSQIFGVINSLSKINIYIFFIFFSLAFAIVHFFTLNLTRPLKMLVSASTKIKEGNFDVTIPKASNDEIGQLSQSFGAMAIGLSERERLKTAFGRFVNKDLAEKALTTDLKVGGELKDAAVLFTDIRSFTDMSEKLSPTELITFLNDYMSRMVTCVTATNGVVDKFIGDAVMAVWGIQSSMGNPTKGAIDSALLMREALISFNLKRASNGLLPIKIGCGISFGPLVSGQIGSNDFMQHTVIGDTVNLASRLESLTKGFGVDIIISESAFEKAGHYYNCKPLDKITIRGKSQPQQIYIVEGKKSDSSSLFNVQDRFKMQLNTEKPATTIAKNGATTNE